MESAKFIDLQTAKSYLLTENEFKKRYITNHNPERGTLFHYKTKESRVYGKHNVMIDIDLKYPSLDTCNNLTSEHLETAEQVLSAMKSLGTEGPIRVTLTARKPYRVEEGDGRVHYRAGMHIYTDVKVYMSYLEKL